MTDQEQPFSSKEIDEQIERAIQMSRSTPADKLPGPDLRLIDDLRHIYLADEQAVSRSLARVRARLAQQSVPQFQHESPHMRSGRRTRVLGERQQSMKGPLSLLKVWQRVSSRLASVVAVLLLLVVVGGLVTGLVLVRQGGKGSVGQSAATTLSAPFATATALPTSIYLGAGEGIYRLDLQTGQRRWFYHLDEYGPDGGAGAAPAVSGGVVYFSTLGHYVYALNASDGTLRWRYQTPDERSLSVTPTVVDGGVYLGGSRQGYAYALNAQDGRLRWRAPVSKDVTPNSFVVTETVVVTDGLVIGSWYNQTKGTSALYALDASTGSLRWTAPAPGGQVFTRVVLVKDVLYVASYSNWADQNEGYVYAYRPGDGSRLWQSAKIAGQVFDPPVVLNIAIYVGTSKGDVYALTLAQGNGLWHKHVANGAVHLAQQTDTGTLYLEGANDPKATESNLLIAVRASDGTTLWTHSAKGIISGSLAVRDGTLYLTEHGARHQLVMLNANTGSVMNRVEYTRDGGSIGSVTIA